MDKISIIIPVYNSEPYLNRCLDSIVNQTYNNLEILLIDDGSYDNSVEICLEYSRKDKRIKVFEKAVKGGSDTPVNSLNIGLENFTGRYLGFTDPDDWAELDMYEVLYKTVKSKKVPVGIVNFFWSSDTESMREKNESPIPNNVLNSEELLLYTFHRDIYKSFYFSNWNKLYSSELFKHNRYLRFNTHYTYAYDILLNTMIYLTVGCAGAYNNKPLYHFYQRDDSISHNPSEQMIKDDLKVWEFIIYLLDNKGYYDISIWTKKIHAYHSALYAERSLKNQDIHLFNFFKEKMKCYTNIYLEENKEYPGRNDWFKKLSESSVSQCREVNNECRNV